MIHISKVLKRIKKFSFLHITWVLCTGVRSTKYNSNQFDTYVLSQYNFKGLSLNIYIYKFVDFTRIMSAF